MHIRKFHCMNTIEYAYRPIVAVAYYSRKHCGVVTAHRLAYIAVILLNTIDTCDIYV